MKANWFIKFTAVLLAVWYMFAVTGFDIHRCSGNGRTYIEPLVAGISCNDIHPDTPCCHHDRTEKHCCGCQEDEDCCTDEIEVIILAG